MKINIEIPKTLDDITLAQYKRFLNIQKQTEESHFLNAKAIEVFCDVELKNVMRIKIADFNNITNKINLLFEQKPSLVKQFKINGIEYGFNPQLDDMTLGEYIDIDTYIGDWENMEKTMNVLYRPIVSKIKKRYAIKEYDVNTSDALLDMPLSAVLSSIFFLWNLGNDLSKTILKYSEAEQGTNLMQSQTLTENGVGINQSTRYLTEILNGLKILLN